MTKFNLTQFNINTYSYMSWWQKLPIYHLSIFRWFRAISDVIIGTDNRLSRSISFQQRAAQVFVHRNVLKFFSAKTNQLQSVLKRITCCLLCLSVVLFLCMTCFFFFCIIVL
uniref:Uncharacterized protein n=1 Tax=Cacopsylla melanoneura TaxID=428564 RepID=A0A8D9AAQ4_9HEMI